MSVIQVAFPVLTGRRRFHVEKGRRWSLVEHLMLDAVVRQPSSAAELAERSNLPKRIVVEAFIRLMRVGWVELAPEAQGMTFNATAAGRAQIDSGELKAPTVIQPRWMGFVFDQVTGSAFRRTEITVRHPKELSKADETLVYLARSERHIQEDLAELFAAMEGEDETILRVDPSSESLVDRYAVVTVTNGVIEGLPGRAKPELHDAILAKAAEAVAASESATTAETTVSIVSDTKAAPVLDPVTALFQQSDLILDGPDHKNALDGALGRARDRVIIHSTFLSEDSMFRTLPALLNAASRGVVVHILWGQDDETPNNSSSRRAAAALQVEVKNAGRSDLIVVHRHTTRSHAKVLASDDGAGGWTAIVGSCNWLSSNFQSYEASILLRDPRLVGQTIKHLGALSLGPPGVWDDLSKDLTILGRRIASYQRPNGSTARMQLLLAPDHSDLVLEARDRARKRIFVTSHRIGIAGRPMVIIPALSAAKAGSVEAQLYYGRPTGVLSGVNASGLASEFARQGVSIKPVHRPRLHAKVLAWDDDALAITSQNWLSADPVDGAPLREIGVFVQSTKVADYFVRKFEHARDPR